MQIITYLAVGLLAGLMSLPSSAHEFWLEPSDFQPKVGDVVTVDLVIGTHFGGFSSPYTPDEIAAFGLIEAAGTTPITGRFGDCQPVNLLPHKWGCHCCTIKPPHPM